MCRKDARTPMPGVCRIDSQNSQSHTSLSVDSIHCVKPNPRSHCTHTANESCTSSLASGERSRAAVDVRSVVVNARTRVTTSLHLTRPGVGCVSPRCANSAMCRDDERLSSSGGFVQPTRKVRARAALRWTTSAIGGGSRHALTVSRSDTSRAMRGSRPHRTVRTV